MTDKQILDEVYRKLEAATAMPSTQDAGSVRRFIEQEWQKRDEQELVDQYNRNRKPEDYIVDVAEIEKELWKLEQQTEEQQSSSKS